MIPSQTIQTQCITNAQWTLSYAGTALSDSDLTYLEDVSKQSGCLSLYDSALKGVHINASEDRPVLHHACRKPGHSVYQSQLNDLQYALDHLNDFKHIVYVGIGGSYIGPKLLDQSFKMMGLSPLKDVSFISSVDPQDVFSVLRSLDLSSTLFVLVSKSGSTRETMDNFSVIRSFLSDHGRSASEQKAQCVTITTKGSLLDDESLFSHRFYMDEGIGGRFSISSLVGMLLVTLVYGLEHSLNFLKGAHDMDQASLSDNFLTNMALFSANLNYFYRVKKQYRASGVIPYSSALETLPDYLQQLICESLGKSSQHATGPLVVGGIGPNLQHSLFQHFHDSPDVVPLQFILFKQSSEPGFQAHQQLLNQQGLSQLIAFSKRSLDSKSESRPANLLFSDRLSPMSLGSLIAYYENTVLFESALYKINAFDQPAVEHGKKVMTQFDAKSIHDPILSAYLDLLS